MLRATIAAHIKGTASSSAALVCQFAELLPQIAPLAAAAAIELDALF